jgi:hypothetical protein
MANGGLPEEMQKKLTWRRRTVGSAACRRLAPEQALAGIYMQEGVDGVQRYLARAAALVTWQAALDDWRPRRAAVMPLGNQRRWKFSSLRLRHAKAPKARM